MKNMSFVSLMNILISTVEEKDVTKKATQEDNPAKCLWDT